MALECLVPVSAEVIEQNPACVTGGECRDGILLVSLEAWRQDHGERRSWPTETSIHWGPTYPRAVQALSGRCWPRRYWVTTAEGWYDDRQGRRHDLVPVWKGRCLKRQVSQVTRRAGVFLAMIAGIGCRRAAWRLAVLFQVGVSKAARARWREAVAEGWPSAEASVAERNRRPLITEGHCDSCFPRGANGKGVRGWRDEHGRIMATDEGEAEQAAPVTPCLRRLKRLGLQSQTFSIEHRQALRHASPGGYPQARLPYADFHLSQHICQKLWRDVRAHRQAVAARRPEVRTAWYRDQLAALAKTLWQKRERLFKADERLSPEAKQPVVELMAADPKVGQW